MWFQALQRQDMKRKPEMFYAEDKLKEDGIHAL